MNYCTHCGKENKEDIGFCVDCGQKLQSKSEELAKPVSPLAPSQPVKMNKPMSKKHKVLYGLIGTLLVLLLVAHFTLKSHYDPMKKIEAMNDAYHTQDAEAFYKQFHLEKEVVGDAVSFFALINEESDYWPTLREDIIYELEKLKEKRPVDRVAYVGGYLSIQKKPVLFGLYHEIDYMLVPKEVSVYAPFKNMTIQFGGKEVISEEDDEEIVLGEFIGGNYNWSYSYEDGLMPLAGEGQYLVWGGDHEYSVDLDWQFETLYLESDLEDAIVFVNGKSTEKTVAELYKLYPAQLQPESKIHAEIKGKDDKVLKSKEIAIDEDYLYLPFTHIQEENERAEHEETVRKLFKDFRYDYEEAIWSIDFSYIADYFKDGSEIKKDYKKFVEDHKEIPGYDYHFMDNDIVSFKAISDEKFELESFETFTFDSDQEKSRVHYERKKKYTISYQDGNYYIDEIKNLDTKKTTQ